jgi:hypothetical protein
MIGGQYIHRDTLDLTTNPAITGCWLSNSEHFQRNVLLNSGQDD